MTANNLRLEETDGDVLRRDPDLADTVGVLDRDLRATHVIPALATVATAIQRFTAERRDQPRQSTPARRFIPSEWERCARLYRRRFHDASPHSIEPLVNAAKLFPALLRENDAYCAGTNCPTRLCPTLQAR